MRLLFNELSKAEKDAFMDRFDYEVIESGIVYWNKFDELEVNLYNVDTIYSLIEYLNNMAYEKGLSQGKFEIQDSIKKLLGIEAH